ncbi:MAG: undecaprenyldiphospho-muramoylpentapeptide beta-N-acetylglucosaminyltransferase [Oligoflexales bacterium]|nr:undecaprenyldiphospho-muramoylpentapeptide beta-N-acetylglucosaminyltransferase [Oligoflexales bacterium]
MPTTSIEPSQVRLVLTGGGTAGHVIPHIARLPALRQQGFDLLYIGSNGMEKNLIEAQGIPFRSISCGKLRRYLSKDNLIDLFKVVWGIVQSLSILIFCKKKQLVLSQGGYVSVPVAVAAWLLRIPVVTHESDASPGLATRILAKFSKKILCSFKEALPSLPKPISLYTGHPVREELHLGKKDKGFAFCSFDPSETRPVLLFMGGSLGAQLINEALLKALPELLKQYRVIHLTGKGKSLAFKDPGYKSFEFVGKELPDLFSITDYVIARAGANSIFEFLALEKPMLLIPLERGSRGDQILNAKIFQDHGWARVLREQDLSAEQLILDINTLKNSATNHSSHTEKSASVNSQSKPIQLSLDAIQTVLG